MTLLVGCYYAADKPHIEGELPAARCTIKEFCGVVGSGVEYIDDDIILRGRVTSCDRERNFYRSLMVEDATGGVEVMVGYYDLYDLYPEGLEVALSVRGCAAVPSRDIVQIGLSAPAYDYYAVDYLDAQPVVDRVVCRGLSVEPVTPARISVGELTDRYCGRLVRLDSLRLVASTSIDTLANMLEARWRGTAIFTDGSGDSIAVYTRNYARYADNIIPDSLRSLTGIVQSGRYDGRDIYHIKMRYESDAVAY